MAGTAWHWVDPAAGAAKAAQVLLPGGLLAPFHHVLQPPPEVSEAASAAYRRVAPDSPFNQASRPSRSGLDLDQPLFDKIADGIGAAGRFTEPEDWRFGWERTCTRDEWLDQLPTLGSHPAPAGGRGHGAGGRRGRDRRAGRQLHDVYTTVAVTAGVHPARATCPAWCRPGRYC